MLIKEKNTAKNLPYPLAVCNMFYQKFSLPFMYFCWSENSCAWSMYLNIYSFMYMLSLAIHTFLLILSIKLLLKISQCMQVILQICLVNFCFNSHLDFRKARSWSWLFMNLFYFLWKVCIYIVHWSLLTKSSLFIQLCGPQTTQSTKQIKPTEITIFF